LEIIREIYPDAAAMFPLLTYPDKPETAGEWREAEGRFIQVWLAAIGETDRATIREILENGATDLQALEWWRGYVAQFPNGSLPTRGNPYAQTKN